LATVTPPSLDNTMGAALVGLLISTALYGVSCLQTYIYYRTYRQTDRAWIQILVLVLWILDTLHSCCISHAVYFYLVSNYGNYVSLLTAVWSIILPVGLNCFSGFLVQFFFLWRLWIVNGKNWFLPALIGVISVAQLAIGLAMMGIGFHLRLFSGLVRFKGVVTGSLGSTALADILIAGGLCYHLYNKKTGFKNTDGIINNLILYSINNGLFTSVIAIAGFISFLAMPTNLVNFALNFVLGKVYSNSMLSSLNTRELLKKQRGHIAIDLSSNTALPGSSTQSNKNNDTAVEINISTTRSTQADNSFGMLKINRETDRRSPSFNI